MNTPNSSASETHITLAVMNAETLQRIQDWVEKAGLKWTVIELSSGDHPFQPMITFGGIGTIAEQLERARKITGNVTILGGNVNRIKVEVRLSTESTVDVHRYFEHHFKLELPVDANLDDLGEVIQPHGARLSRNARRRDSQGVTQRFVTLRDYGSDPAKAEADCKRLREELQAAGYRIIEAESERVVFDSNLELDAGWL